MGRIFARSRWSSVSKILAEMLDSLAEDGTIRYGQHIEAEGKPILDEACKLRLRASFLNARTASYTSGRTKSWVKVKCVRRQEFVVGGFTKPNNGTEGIGALLLGHYKEKKLIYAGRTGTGFTQVSSHKLRKQLEGYAANQNAF